MMLPQKHRLVSAKHCKIFATNSYSLQCQALSTVKLVNWKLEFMKNIILFMLLTFIMVMIESQSVSNGFGLWNSGSPENWSQFV